MSDRYSFFEFPHKPFRFMWMEEVSSIGNVNYTDDVALDALQTMITLPQIPTVITTAMRASGSLPSSES